MKKPMTVRLHENNLNKLNIIATQRGMTRQDLVEKILIDASNEMAEGLTNNTVSYVPSHILELIKTQSEKLAAGTEISLKKIVGEEQWSNLPDATRRVFGKQFRDMVANGEFPNLKEGRKKSNNEQQYTIL
ncbi:hypothetical protein A9267_10860 [Shewanella sp. UCD-FRSSP16_17]|uniref:single-stranded DNA-binding protein n=1 Tax=Shewanella sp. UCD-FRSSP16_17 TaxID=1853256 RepID=UPI0007EEF524|nr:single-stranded DNA-binding protein [Shewanella sp. UCD-FRSSP16_17]OBT08211.1 hypothetical protein A9267_10860 [Shewanella sp. UCD-FRSSP16_17]